MLPLISWMLLAAPPVVDANQPSTATKSKPITTDIDFRAVITAPQNTKRLRVWVPVPPSDETQTVSPGEWSVFPNDIPPTFSTETVFGNRFAYFEFDAPQGAVIISHRFRSTTHDLMWHVSAANVNTPTEWPPSFEPFRRGETLIKVDDQFRKVAEQIVPKRRGNAADLATVMDWVQDNLTYDHSNTSLSADSTHALTVKRGDCSDYHGLCSSLGRSLGVPTRVAYGMHLFPKNLPSHCKLEAYLPPYGWVSFDVSETQRLIGRIRDTKLAPSEKESLIAAATARLRGGFRDNTWLLVTRGTDYELAPKASCKVPLISTIWAEADGVPLPAPDPADPKKREFAWMTSHKYTTDKPVVYPFRDWSNLASP